MSEILNTILCVKWGDKYDDDYVMHLKSQIDQNICTKNDQNSVFVSEAVHGEIII